MTARILVVDDEPDLEALVSQKFRKQIKIGEFGFLFAHDGEEALNMLGTEKSIDLILSDINMPRMDGLTLLQRIGEIDEDLKTVIVSAYGDMANIRTAMNLGAFDFITKPIEFGDLETTIRKTITSVERFRESHRLRMEAERARANLSRFFSPNLAQRLAENPEALNRGTERRVLTIMFTDMADFTPLVETTEPSVIAPLLNEYFDSMTRIVFEHGGTVCKIVGDAVHAVFGAPVDQPDHAAKAVQCALAIDRFSENFRKCKSDQGIIIGATRIGVHTGPVIVGNFGGESYFDYSVYGIATNIAARLEGANKHLGTRVCVSEDVTRQISDFCGRPIGNLTLKGLTKGLQAFEPLDAGKLNQSSTAAYFDAYGKLESGDPTARAAFASVVGQFQDDPLATFHLRRLLAGETGVAITFSEK